MTNARQRSPFIFTGWHMLVIMVGFFGTIIAVNLLMAWFAATSWSGLVVQNTYVASQQFNGRAAMARAMAATGIKGHLSIDGAIIRYALTHPQTGPVDVDAVRVRFKRPVGEHQDFVAEMTATGAGAFVGTHAIQPGQWIVEATSYSDARIVMHEALRIVVKAGGL